MSETCVGISCCPRTLYPSGFVGAAQPAPVTATGTSFSLFTVTIPTFASAYGDSTFQVVSSGVGREVPAGMYFDTDAGTISGQPTVSGEFQLTVLIEDAYGNSAFRKVKLTITAGTPPEEPEGIALGDPTIGVALGDPTAGVMLGEPQ